MTRYPHNCDTDREQELIEADERRLHDDGDCPRDCSYCELDRERNESSLGG